jgi:hypothetical protein
LRTATEIPSEIEKIKIEAISNVVRKNRERVKTVIA